MGDNFILGAQWYSTDNGLTWERVPPEPLKTDTTMTVVKVDYTRDEVTVRMDLQKVFGVRPPRVTHALDGSYPNGGIKARAACGETMAGPILDPKALTFEQRAEATCPICRAS